MRGEWSEVLPPHELPEQSEGEGSIPFVQILTRNADQRELGLLLSQLHGVVTVLQLERTNKGSGSARICGCLKSLKYLMSCCLQLDTGQIRWILSQICVMCHYNMHSMCRNDKRLAGREVAKKRKIFLNENIFHKQSLAAVNEYRNISRIHSGIRRQRGFGARCQI